MCVCEREREKERKFSRNELDKRKNGSYGLEIAAEVLYVTRSC